MHDDIRVTMRAMMPTPQGVGVFLSDGAKVIAISSKPTPFSTINTPVLEGYSNILALMAGWNLLIQVGQKLGVNLDKPERARKVGNAI